MLGQRDGLSVGVCVVRPSCISCYPSIIILSSHIYAGLDASESNDPCASMYSWSRIPHEIDKVAKVDAMITNGLRKTTLLQTTARVVFVASTVTN